MLNLEQQASDSPLYLNTETRPWRRMTPDTPRRAGISSFGFGGTNYHVVLQEYEAEAKGPYRLHRTARPFVFSAPDAEMLLAQCRDYLWPSKAQFEHEPAGNVPLLRSALRASDRLIA
ncbi:MAG TPA: ketoacyl-synthetase C-terminal extension domain-containing protein [Chloroflexota bacterium]|nr:ketoacyl-synthetase C-terminal extension domain-containing protein [Chloroflexota bacterium]